MMDEAGVKVQLYTQIADVIMDGNRVLEPLEERLTGRFVVDLAPDEGAAFRSVQQRFVFLRFLKMAQVGKARRVLQ